MKQRNSILKCAALIAPTAIVATSCSEQPEQPTKPNVIVILADDLGYGDVSAYGSSTISTPNIDRLANEGVSFTNGYATSATSTPSRYALFTGSYPWKNPNAKILPGDAPLLIGVDQFTMPKMMQSAGYTTAAIGKWHLGMGVGNVNWNETITPGAREIGFDYSCLIAATNDRVPTVFVENGDVVGLEKDDPIEVNYNENYGDQPTGLNNPELLKMQWAHGHNGTIVNEIPRIGYMKGGENAKWVDEDMADYFVGKVKNFLDENTENPFFLYYGLHQPHVPRTPNGRFVGATTMGPRGDAVMEADWCVGELLAMLEERGMLENTLIIFSSDNGPVLNDGYKDGAWELLGDHKPAGGLRGGKYSLFDAGTHVPFFTYWKGKITPHKSAAFVSQLDLLASVAELVGEEIPEGLDTNNYLDTFMGKSDEGRENYIVEAMGRLAYRSGDYAMIPPFRGNERNLTGNELGNVKAYSLYNLTQDPTQQTEISAENPEVLERMKKEFLTLAEGYYNANTAEEVLK
ncbi:MAG: sulfatase-like hydrolase/transferase [Rikenellaceae bacterium]